MYSTEDGNIFFKTDNSERVRINSTGNVGIGTTLPSQTLHVQGNARITGALYDTNNQVGTASSVLISVGTGVSWSTFSGTGSNISISTNTTNQNQYLTYVTGVTSSVLGISSTGVVFNPGVGNFGINTSSPTARLSVVTPTTGDSILQVSDNVSTGSMFRVNSSTGYPLVDIDGDGTVLFLTPGNVGIGTTITSPTFKLEVGGDTNIKGTLTVNGINFGSSISIGGSMTVGTGFYGDGSKLTNVPGTISLSNNTANQNQYLSYGIGTGSTAILYVNTSGLVFNPGAGNLGINTLPTARLSVASTTGDSILQVSDNVASGSMFRVNSSTGYTLMDVDGDGTVLFPTGGNVGIGSIVTSPTNKLEVGGNVKITGALVDSTGQPGGSGQVLKSTVTGTQWDAAGLSNISISANTNSQSQYLTFVSSPTASVTGLNVNTTSGLVFDPGNGRLGINTVTPTSRLSVVTPTTGDSILQVADNFATGSMFRVNNTSGYPLVDIDGDGTVLFLTPGNVGIGSTIITPTNKLEVAGTVSATAFSGSGASLTTLNATNISSGTVPVLRLGSSGTRDATTYLRGDNTWATVSGNINIAANVDSQNQYLTFVAGTGSTSTLNANSNSSSGLVFNPGAGRLGINTSSPTSRLTVVTPTTGDSIFRVNDNVSSGSMLRVNDTTGYPLMDVDGDGTILFPGTGNFGIGPAAIFPTSKLEVDGNTSISGDLLFNSGYGSTATAYGCRAWVSFDTSGTRLGSGNVSSVVNNSTGTYTVNFTTSMPDINYSAISNSSSNTSSRVDTYNTGSLRVLTYDVGLTNPTRCSVAVFR
jgi:hypothetical protein